MGTAVQQLTSVETRLAGIETIADAKQLDAEAAAFREFAKQSKADLPTVNRLQTIRFLAQRRGGELLARMPRADVGGPISGAGRKHPVSFKGCLAREGIAESAAYTWMHYAQVPEEKFREMLAHLCADDGELTASALVAVVGSFLLNRTRPPQEPPPKGNRELTYEALALLGRTLNTFEKELAGKIEEAMAWLQSDRTELDRYHYTDGIAKVRQLIDNLRILEDRLAIAREAHPTPKRDPARVQNPNNLGFRSVRVHGKKTKKTAKGRR